MTQSLPTSRLVTLDEMRSAMARVSGAIIRTPLVAYEPAGPPKTAGEPQRTVLLKAESLQRTGSFKARGAYNAIASLSPDQRARGVVAHSSGNHAQGVAWAAQRLGVRAVVVMPSNAPAVKLERTRAYGAEVVVVGPASDERASRAEEIAKSDGLAMIDPHDDLTTIAGQATTGLEIVEQFAEWRERLAEMQDVVVADSDESQGLLVLVPIGGGGLASGVAAAVKTLVPHARVVGVEPELAADCRESLQLGRIVSWPAERVSATIADGQRLQSVGRYTFEHMRRYLDDVVAVTEDEIRRAMVRAQAVARLVTEPSGATSLAACLFHAEELPASRYCVCVVSGGNVDTARYAALLQEGLALGG